MSANASSAPIYGVELAQRDFWGITDHGVVGLIL